MNLFKSQSRLFLVSITSLQILQFASVSSALDVGSDMTFNQDYYETINITADNITVNMNGYSVHNVTGNPGNGITIDGRSSVTIQNGNIYSCTGAGIEVKNSSDITIDNMWINANSGEGFKLRNSEYVDIMNSISCYNSDGFDQNYGSCSYFNCNAFVNVTNGLEVDNGNGIGYYQCISYYNGLNQTDGGRHGISISDQSAYGEVVGCVASYNGGDGLHMNTGANNFIFISDTAQGNVQDGISLDEGSSNNAFYSCFSNSNGRNGVRIRDNSNNNYFSYCNMLSNSVQNVDYKGTGNTFPNCTY